MIQARINGKSRDLVNSQNTERAECEEEIILFSSVYTLCAVATAAAVAVAAT